MRGFMLFPLKEIKEMSQMTLKELRFHICFKWISVILGSVIAGCNITATSTLTIGKKWLIKMRKN